MAGHLLIGMIRESRRPLVLIEGDDMVKAINHSLEFIRDNFDKIKSMQEDFQKEIVGSIKIMKLPDEYKMEDDHEEVKVFDIGTFNFDDCSAILEAHIGLETGNSKIYMVA